MNEMQKRKIMNSTQEELLRMLLNDTNLKFQKVIDCWKDGSIEKKIEGNGFLVKLMDNITELQCTLNTEHENPSIQQALVNIQSLYAYINKELFRALPKSNYQKVEEMRKVFMIIVSIFVPEA